MDFTNIGLDFLTQETVNLAKSIGNEFSFENEESLDERLDAFCLKSENEKTCSDFKKTFPIGPGIIFQVDVGISTICLKGKAVSNISDSMNDIDEEGIRAPFKVDEDIHFFETPKIEVAQAILHQLFNRRFPIEEELICNVSDPGFSWWMGQESNSLKIYFKSHGIDRSQNLVKLGPIGDNHIARKRFKNLVDLIALVMPVSNYKLDRFGFEVNLDSVSSNEIYLKELKQVFLTGDIGNNIAELIEHSNNKTLWLYLNELSFTRKFWWLIEENYLQVKKSIS